jgi:phosphoglucosamine mutase
MTRLFGTDGIRGLANAEPLTTELVFRLGRQLVATLLEHHGVAKVRLVVGRDTRQSGPMLEGALVSGALSAGADVFVVGVLPTPGIAHLARHLETHGGVVISASHNPFEDNGIKIFSSEGAKFPDAWEDEIEARLAGPDRAPKPTGADVGRLISHRHQAESDYAGHAAGTFSFDLQGFHVVLDCANGATYRVGPRVFETLGAKVTVLGAEPDGQNINRGVGALHPEGLQARVRATQADLGVAFDGDGDRLICVDESGEVRDGDFALAICGRHLAAQGRLRGGVVVSTVMANLGLEHSLRAAGIQTVKTQVGDRYVLEEMVRIGAVLGGEQSGHLLFLDHTTTDGIVSALQVLSVMRETDQPLSALAACLTKFPQVLVNVRVRKKPPLASIAGLQPRLETLEGQMNGAGRILLRYSGTELLARVMVEGQEQQQIEGIAQELAGIIRRAIGS